MRACVCVRVSEAVNGAYVTHGDPPLLRTLEQQMLIDESHERENGFATKITLSTIGRRFVDPFLLPFLFLISVTKRTGPYVSSHDLAA